MRSFIYLVLFVILLQLQSCATLSEAECKRGNWYDIGLRDGARGRSITHYNKHIEACSKYAVRFQQRPYQKGYQQGLRSYCTHSSGFKQGNAINEYYDVCRGPSEREFLGGYIEGLKTAEHEINADLYDARRERNHIEDDIHSTSNEKDKTNLNSELDSIEREIERLRDKQDTLHDYLHRYHSHSQRPTLLQTN